MLCKVMYYIKKIVLFIQQKQDYAMMICTFYLNKYDSKINIHASFKEYRKGDGAIGKIFLSV